MAELGGLVERLNPMVVIKGSMPLPRGAAGVIQGLVAFDTFLGGLGMTS